MTTPTLALERLDAWNRPSEAVATLGARLPTGWALMVLFVGLPIWWAAGLGGFIQLLVPAPLVVWVLARARVVRFPRVAMPWVLFLAWVPITALQIREPTRLLSAGYRYFAYVAATLLFLYVLGTDRQRLRSSTLVKALAVFWVLTVLGGFVSMLLPTTSFTSPVEALLPAGLANNAFVQSLVHPGTTSQNAFAGTAIYRPKAPFAYTNQWGAAYAVTLPFAIAALSYVGSPVARRGLQILLGASLVPLVFSLDRGAWLSASIGLGYALVRLTWGRRARSGVMLAVALCAAALVVVVSPLGQVINNRLEHGHGDKKRAALYEASLDLARASPIFGAGSPVPIDEHPRSPSVGTHGQMWLVLVAHGYVGVALCFGFFALLLLRSIRVPRHGDPATERCRFWSHIAIVIAMTQIPYYMWIPWILPVIFVAAAVVLRESEPRLAAAEGLPAGPDADTDDGDGETEDLAAGDGNDEAAGSRRERAAVLDPAPVLAGLRGGLPPAQGEPEIVDEFGLLARSGALTIAGTIGSAVSGFVLVVAATRGLGVGDAGAFLQAVAMFSLLAGVTKLGADTGVVRAIPRYRVLGRTADLQPLLRTALWRPVATAVACAAVLFVFADSFGRVLFSDGADGAHLVRLLAPFLPLSTALAVLAAASRGFGAFVPFVVVQNLGVPVARALLVAGVTFVGATVTGVALLWSIPVAVAAALCWAATRVLFRTALHRDDTTSPPSAARAVRSDFWRFALPRGGAAALQTTMLWLDVVLVGALVSSAAAGMYSAANRYVVAGTFAMNALGMTIGPQISRLLTSGRLREARELFRTSTWWIIAVSWPPAMVLVVFAPPFLRIFGDEYVAAVPTTRILGVSLLFAMATGTNKVVLLMAGHSRVNLAITAVGLAVYLGLNAILIPAMGMNGAALAWVASGQMDNFATSVVVHRRYGISPFGRGLHIAVVASTVCFGLLGVVAAGLLGDDVLGLSAALVAGVPTYGAVLWRYRRALKLHAIRSVLRRRDAAPAAVPA